jgi:hypothetical protein
MGKTMKLTVVGPITAFAVATAAQAATLASSQARNHIGETATVCDTVASAHYAPRSRAVEIGSHSLLLRLQTKPASPLLRSADPVVGDEISRGHVLFFSRLAPSTDAVN